MEHRYVKPAQYNFLVWAGYLPEDLNLLEDNVSLVLNRAILNCTLLNFSDKVLLLSIFEDCPDEFEYTANGVFRRTTHSLCPKCGSRMNYNSYNTYRKAS